MNKFNLLFLKNVSSILNKRLIIRQFIIAFLFCFSSFAQSAKDHLQKGLVTDNFKVAIVEYSKAISLNPNFFEAYYLRAKDKHSVKDLKGSVIDFKKAITLKPNYAYSYYYIGKAYQDLEKHDEAITYFLKFIEILKIEDDSDIPEDITEIVLSDFDANVSIGESHFFQKNFKDAIIYLSKALNTFSENPDIFYLRGKAKANLNDYQGAILDYNNAIALDSNDVRYYKSRGYSKSFLKDYEGAINDFLRIQILDPENKTAYYTIGLFYKFQGKSFESIKFFNLALEFNNSPISECYFERGNAKSNLEDYRGAVMDFTKALEHNPKLYECYYLRGEAKLFLDDKKGAILDITKYIIQSPNGEYIKFAYSQRGLAKIGLNQKESGCLDLSKSGELGYEGAYESIKELCK